jgi:2-methylisocitrate lyase-like PEP mutase family enzyme
MARPTTILKTILSRREATIIAGAANGFFARIIEDIGYEAVYVTGAGVANMYLGAPDIGLTTLTEIADHVSAIADAVALPLLVDADTGFGNPVNMVRTVKVLERAGAAGLQIEDQLFPKKCGHFDGKQVVPLDEMLAKIKAAVDTRRDSDLQIVARTDARAILGLQAAIDRAGAMIEAGADVTFVEAPISAEELAEIARSLSVPQVANIVFGGLTPELGQQKFGELGFGCVLYANAALQAALKASHDVLQALKREGSLASVADRLAGFDIRQQTVAKPRYDELERRYAAIQPSSRLEAGNPALDEPRDKNVR